MAIEREVVAVLRDVSERKAQEQALENARAELERANAGKSRFLATMSHELRTPLNAIIGFSEMLTDETLVVRCGAAAGIRQADQRFRPPSFVGGQRHSRHVENGNRQFRDHAGAVRAGAGDRRAAAICWRSRRATPASRSRPRVANDLPELVADRRALNQILINLISNAIKFTPRGGSVTVTARRDGQLLAISVEDTGVGIGEDDLPRLGEAFFQARASYDRRHDGSGLGLSIVKGLVRLHGGDMDIRSRLGEGTRVTVRLPVDGEGARPAADPIKLVFDRAGDLAAAAETQVKKSA